MTVYNASCDTQYDRETMQTLRVRMMRRLGYSAQATNPPPGMSELLRDYLSEAQRLVYREYLHIWRLKRWFSWTLVPGERFYGFAGNDETVALVDPCSKVMQPDAIDWVGVSELDGSNWTPLHQGIDPRMFSDQDVASGRPMRFESGQRLELWPVPSEPMILRVHAAFGLLPFAVDADYTTVDPDIVWLRAMTNAKAHAKQPDATNYHDQEVTRLQALCAATHGMQRYIPRDMTGYATQNPGVSGPAGTRYVTEGDARTVAR